MLVKDWLSSLEALANMPLGSSVRSRLRFRSRYEPAAPLVPDEGHGLLRARPPQQGSAKDILPGQCRLLRERGVLKPDADRAIDQHLVGFLVIEVNRVGWRRAKRPPVQPAPRWLRIGPACQAPTKPGLSPGSLPLASQPHHICLRPCGSTLRTTETPRLAAEGTDGHLPSLSFIERTSHPRFPVSSLSPFAAVAGFATLLQRQKHRKPLV